MVRSLRGRCCDVEVRGMNARGRIDAEADNEVSADIERQGHYRIGVENAQ